jgi:DNA-binding HxlR family transcriptional regulator
MSEDKKRARRSDCPVNFMVEVFGDKWSLLIVRDSVFFGKKTYGDFLKSDERIATNILANRLALLEREGILNKTPHPTDKRKDEYILTEKGMDLVPIILEIVEWSAKYDSSNASAMAGVDKHVRREFVEQIRRNKKKTVGRVKEIVRNGGFVFSQE